MNPETEQMLKRMGFVPAASEPDRESGMVSYCVPHTEFQIEFYPKSGPEALMRAIWKAGGEAKRKEIAKARDAYHALLS